MKKEQKVYNFNEEIFLGCIRYWAIKYCKNGDLFVTDRNKGLFRISKKTLKLL